jgi:hypothetical protein
VRLQVARDDAFTNLLLDQEVSPYQVRARAGRSVY